MFEALDAAPPDPILGLTEAFKADTNPDKINLGVGVFKDEQGTTPTLDCVREAEKRMLEANTAKTYLSIEGSAEYGKCVRQLLFGADHELVGSGRALTAHTPGGTGALRVAADFLSRVVGAKRLWLSDPTWANHPKVFAAAGLEVAKYPYYDPATKGLDFTKMRDALSEVQASDVVLLHACCHNPTGVDPTPEQWGELAALRSAKGFLPLFDFAYQGFGDGLERDAAGLREFVAQPGELLVASSFSKNFGLYNERVGALTLIGKEPVQTASAFSHIKATVRANYSNPPAHGAGIITTILSDTALTKQWHEELATMRSRIIDMRKAFVEGLRAQGVKQDFSFIAQQRGMFSFSGLTKAQVATLRSEHSIYIVDSGRINVAGMTPSNLPRLCQAIASVL